MLLPNPHPHPLCSLLLQHSSSLRLTPRPSFSLFEVSVSGLSFYLWKSAFCRVHCPCLKDLLLREAFLLPNGMNSFPFSHFRLTACLGPSLTQRGFRLQLQPTLPSCSAHESLILVEQFTHSWPLDLNSTRLAQRLVHRKQSRKIC